MEFEEQVKTVYSELLRFARALEGSTGDGDDLLQEALLRGWNSYHNLKDPDSFKSWMIIIIKNTARTRARYKWWRRFTGLESVGEVSIEAELGFEEKELVRAALKGVPRLQREALVLYEVLGMSVTEIAKIQNATPSAVKSRLSRGRQKLREEYGKLDTEEDYHAGPIARTI